MPQIPHSPLILASTSPYRRALMDRLGIPFSTRKPPFDEDSLKGQGLKPVELAKRLAFEKAKSAQNPSSTPEVVIGSDQLAYFCDDQGQEVILGKPLSRQANILQLERLSGRAHHLITAVTVLKGAEEWHFLDDTILHFRRLSRALIESVVDRDQPWDCAGGYKFERAGITLIQRLECADPTAIEGLPLIQLSTVLQELGYFES